MAGSTATTAVAAYFTELRRIQASGGATGERSAYGALTDLLNAVGDTLRPKVFCVPELADQGAGHPDFGLYTTRQTQRARDQRQRRGQLPERGVVEVKSAADDAWLTAHFSDSAVIAQRPCCAQVRQIAGCYFGNTREAWRRMRG